MNASNQRLQAELTQARQTRRRFLKGWALFTCESSTCATMEVNVFLDESAADVRPWQAPAKCVRCGQELTFDKLDLEG